MNDKNSFLQRVKNQIKSAEAKQFVAKELDHHIEKKVEQLIDAGNERDVAELKAVQQMGDPIKLGLKMGHLHRPKVDWGLISLFIFLQLIGLLPLLVTSSKYQPSIYQQTTSIFFGIVCAICLMLFDYRKLKEKWWLIIGAFGVILMVFFYFGTYVNGNPYIRFGPFKTNSIIVLPFLFISWAGVFYQYTRRYVLITGIFLFSVLLYAPISVFSNLFIYIVVVFAMYIWTIRKHRKRVIGTFIAWIIGTIIIFIWKYNEYYMKHRLLGFLFPEQHANESGYLNIQIKKYLSEAGWLGQKRNLEHFLLPESHTDFAFVTFTYSFGWIFSILLILFLATITMRMFWISRKVVDPFGQLIIIGAVTLYSVPFVYNIAMVLGLLPLAGIGLPFISYGTVHVLINSMLIGLVLSVYRRKDLFTTAA
ncbi:FtsW/RodA/SpoVE family cell cycle protein [Bacillus sp. FJAT-50079]|uniref:FtsW/RodA/SpoVE family cell cycle protein n=1 Tax=Bacillus sp. FJAT-50079 TaxID=2833577 RepID=UPI001BC9954D|nr:FtsW/RodA/SpoVE family cell cycle protein [Bacillus sp. FJAT-50079]MBS4209262.1 FtsW/RodA/SpoVE family cell cycle protein [Bacillus sp. FJAT-50079]